MTKGFILFFFSPSINYISIFGFPTPELCISQLPNLMDLTYLLNSPGISPHQPKFPNYHIPPSPAPPYPALTRTHLSSPFLSLSHTHTHTHTHTQHLNQTPQNTSEVLCGLMNATLGHFDFVCTRLRYNMNGSSPVLPGPQPKVTTQPNVIQ